MLKQGNNGLKIRIRRDKRSRGSQGNEEKQTLTIHAASCHWCITALKCPTHCIDEKEWIKWMRRMSSAWMLSKNTDPTHSEKQFRQTLLSSDICTHLVLDSQLSRLGIPCLKWIDVWGWWALTSQIIIPTMWNRNKTLQSKSKTYHSSRLPPHESDQACPSPMPEDMPDR